jgi:hypothetical protein
LYSIPPLTTTTSFCVLHLPFFRRVSLSRFIFFFFSLLYIYDMTVQPAIGHALVTAKYTVPPPSFSCPVC